MHTTLVRAQNVFGFFTTVVSVICAIMAVSVLVFSQEPSGAVSIQNISVAKGRPHYMSRKKEEYAQIKFNLEADLSSLFNWNTKQLFVYLVASWPSSSDPSLTNSAVIWDQIIPSDPYKNPTYKNNKKALRSKSYEELKDDRGKILLKKQRAKYQISDVSGLLAGRQNATLELGWNVQPHVGVLTWPLAFDFGVWDKLSGGRSKPFDFPALKGAKKAAAASSS